MNKDKILLIYIASEKRMEEMPYGLIYVSEALKKEGFDVRLIDNVIEQKTEEQLLQDVFHEEPRVVGYGGITAGYAFVKRLSKKIKAQFPSIVQIAGGVLASTEDLLLSNTAIDVVCRGEGERVAPRLLKSLQEGVSYEMLSGISFRCEDGSIKKNKYEPVVEDIDTIPFPDVAAYNFEAYVHESSPEGKYMRWFVKDQRINDIPVEKRRIFNIKTSRGCTGVCSFCYKHIGGEYRRHSPQYVVDVIDFLYNRHDIGLFVFADSLFVFDEAWIGEFEKRVLEKNIKILFRINGARVDGVSEELLWILKRCGCVFINFGFESGSQKILDVIRKQIHVEQNYEVIRLIKKVGMMSYPYFIFGMPGEDKQTLKETIDLIVEWGGAFAHSIATAFPKTWLYRYAKENKMIVNDEFYITSLEDIPVHLNFTKFRNYFIQILPAYVINRVRRKKVFNEKRYVSAFWLDVKLGVLHLYGVVRYSFSFSGKR